jgi:hypothetical protein
MSMKESIVIAELSDALAPDLLNKIQAVADSSSELFRKGHDWKPHANFALIRLFPRGWTYTGGKHIAQHASPPAKRKFTRYGKPVATSCEAGNRLFILAEQ